MFLAMFICLNKDHAYTIQGCSYAQGIVLGVIKWLQHRCMGKCLLEIIKCALHKIILDKMCIIFKQPHKTMCPFGIIVDKMM